MMLGGFMFPWQVQNAVASGNVRKVVDRSLGSSYSVESAWMLAELAVGCTRSAGSARPDIGQVVTALSKAMGKAEVYTSGSTGSTGSSRSTTVSSNSSNDFITFQHRGQPRPC